LKGLPFKCGDCPSKLCIADPKFLNKWKDPLEVTDRRGNRATEVLRDLIAGGSAFLMGGGPSANDLPLELLSTRGMFTLAVNNVAGHPRVRPQAFVCSDPPKKFSHSIWLDPGIMKFAPSAKLGGRRNRLRLKRDGKFEDLWKTTDTCPNVWGFKRWSWLKPDESFLLTDGACWGNHADGVEKTGQPKTVCTMLLGLRLLIFLGAKRIYLVGVDFRMAGNYGYSFGQARDSGACESNNGQFTVVNKWLCEMQENGTFKRFGIEIYNCFQSSGLRAFSYYPFEEAVKEARGSVEISPDLTCWYDK
jgi:hypothetical protein